MPLLANINVGSAPNDGTGDTIRDAFTIVNENFQYIEAFFPNTDVINLTANITSTGTSIFNVLNGATIGNAGSAFTGATVSAATIGNAGSALVGATVSAATIGNTGTTLTGVLDTTSSNQANISSIGSSTTSNVNVVGNIVLSSTSITGLRNLQQTVTAANGGSYSVGMILSNTQIAGFTMNTNVTLTLTGSIESGIQKDFYFINDTGTTKYANIFPWANRTNKGSNSIAVTSNTTALVKIISIDTTIGNVVAIITNS